MRWHQRGTLPSPHYFNRIMDDKYSDIKIPLHLPTLTLHPPTLTPHPPTLILSRFERTRRQHVAVILHGESWRGHEESTQQLVILVTSKSEDVIICSVRTWQSSLDESQLCNVSFLLNGRVGKSLKIVAFILWIRGPWLRLKFVLVWYIFSQLGLKVRCGRGNG